MATAPDLTPTEVIDRVRAARQGPTASSGRGARAGTGVGAAAPLPGRRDPSALGRGRPARRRPGPAGRSRCSAGSRSSHPSDLAAALGITQDAGRQLIADALELDLPAPAALGAGGGRRGPGVAGPADRQGDHRPQRRGGAVRGPADRRHPAQDRPGPGRPARPGGAAVLRPRPRPRRRGAKPSPSAVSGCATAAPRPPPTSSMTLDTPDALLFDQTVTRHRRRPPRASATPRPSRSAAHARSGSSPTPNSPSTSSPAATAQHPATVPARAPRTSTSTSPLQTSTADLADGTGAASIEKLGAATTQLLTDWLTRFAAAGTKITLRPVLDLSLDQGRGPARPTRSHAGDRDPPRRATASSPAAAATPGPATSTTSPNTSPSRTADHRAKPSPANLAPLCRSPPPREDAYRVGTTNASTTAATCWTAPTGDTSTCPDD